MVLVMRTCAESILLDGEDKLFGDEVMGAALFYIIFGFEWRKTEGGRKKEFPAKVIDLFSLYICFSKTDHCCQRKQFLLQFNAFIRIILKR